MKYNDYSLLYMKVYCSNVLRYYHRTAEHPVISYTIFNHVVLYYSTTFRYYRNIIV